MLEFFDNFNKCDHHIFMSAINPVAQASVTLLRHKRGQFNITFLVIAQELAI